MLHNNKTFDNSNIRDVLKVFNDGIATFYKGKEHVLGEELGKLYFSKETIKFDKLMDYYMNSSEISLVIGVPFNAFTFDVGDFVLINNRYFKIRVIQEVIRTKPPFLKLSLEQYNRVIKND